MVLTWLLYVVIIHFLLTRKRSDSESATPSCETWGLDCELLGRSKYVFIFSILSSCRAPANRRVTNTACFSGMEMEVMEYMRTKEDLKGNSQWHKIRESNQTCSYWNIVIAKNIATVLHFFRRCTPRRHSPCFSGWRHHVGHKSSME